MKEISLMYCEFHKPTKTLRMHRNVIGMPSQFMVTSHETGKQVRFVVIGPEDKLYDQDQWDGEQQIYRPVGHVPNVDHLVIYNG